MNLDASAWARDSTWLMKPRSRSASMPADELAAEPSRSADHDASWRCRRRHPADRRPAALRPGFERDSARQLTGVARFAPVTIARPQRRAGQGADRPPRLPVEAESPRVLGEASRALVSGDTPAVRARLLRLFGRRRRGGCTPSRDISGHDPAAGEPDLVAAPEAADLGSGLLAPSVVRSRKSTSPSSSEVTPDACSASRSPQTGFVRIWSYGSNRAACSGLRANPRHDSCVRWPTWVPGPTGAMDRS